ncbi:MAG: hypothetical protein R3D44_11610 [Hyphomicrobiaceae bacterium]
MVALTLPKNSKVKPGRLWNEPRGDYRWHPDDNADPRLDTCWVERITCKPMVLDALIKIKDEKVAT